MIHIYRELEQYHSVSSSTPCEMFSDLLSLSRSKWPIMGHLLAIVGLGR